MQRVFRNPTGQFDGKVTINDEGGVLTNYVYHRTTGEVVTRAYSHKQLKRSIDTNIASHWWIEDAPDPNLQVDEGL